MESNNKSDIELYRFLNKEYKDHLFLNGNLRIPSFKSLLKNEDPNRKDIDEGMYTLISKVGNMTFECKAGIVLENVFILCLSKSQYSYRKDGDSCLKILNIDKLAKHISGEITKQGYTVLDVVGGDCLYSDRKIEGIMHDNTQDIESLIGLNRDNKTIDFNRLFNYVGRAGIIPIFMKDSKYKKEDEFRLAFFTNKSVDDCIFINFKEPNKFFEERS